MFTNIPQKQNAPRLLVLIINREQLNKISELYEKEYVHLHYICFGQGTAGSEVMDMLGLVSSDKAVIFSFAPRFQIKDILEDAVYKLKLMKPGNGVAFTMPVSGLSSPIMQLIEDMLVSVGYDKEAEQSEQDEEPPGYSLIVAAVNMGFAKKVVTAAKAAKAGGGTIVHAKREGSDKDKTFFGITMNTEREIVMILTKADKKDDIMNMVNESSGPETEAHGIIFSLPVCDVAGVNLD